MHGRMSRLRRSLSRGSLFGGLSRSQLSLVDLPTLHQRSLLITKFSTPSTFPQLRQLVHSNNETLREIISIFDESVVDRAWSYVADQFDAQASIHSNLGSAITDDIVQPLRTIYNSQHQTIRATDQLVNRELRFLNAKRDELSKLKRVLHSSSRDLEKVEQLIDNDPTSNIKLSLKKRKLLEQVTKQEHTYIEETIATERQRRLTDGVLRKGVEYLEIVEKQRLAHCQTALGRFQRKIAQLGPNLNLMFERYMNALNDAVSAEPDDQISMLTPTCSANHTVYLCDFHAENFAEVMAGQRRRWALERVSAILHEYLEQQLETVPTLPSANAANFGFTQTVLTIPLDEFENPGKPTAPSLPTSSSLGDDIEPTVCETRELEHYAVPRSLSYDESANFNNSSSSSTGTSNNETKQIYRVLYDFMATADDELEVHAGDCVLVESKIGKDWLVGQIISNNQIDSGAAATGQDNKIGRFPASYVASAHSI